MKKTTFAASLLFFLGCAASERTPVGPEEPIQTPLPFLDAPAGVFISNPIASAGGRVYVSALPEVLSGFSWVMVRNETTHGTTRSAPLVDGGFDPIAVTAAPGDRISLTFVVTGGQSSSRLVSVPQHVPPSIVRMDPADGAENVPVNTHFSVVFSEPVDKSSLTTSIAVLDGFDPVPGNVLVSPDGLRGEFVPDHPLEWQKKYSLELKPGVRDLDGESIASRSVSTIQTTSAATASLELVFARMIDRQIYRIGLDGTGLIQLTHTGQNVNPAWSPNGNRIAFVRYESGAFRGDVYTMDSDGSNVTRLTEGAGLWSAAWSPDGTRLAVSDEGTYYGSISIISLDPKIPPKQIAKDARSPAWSPDGKKIAFVRLSGDDGYHQIFVMNADGTDVRPVTEFDSGGIFGVSWSPDGKRIAFSKHMLDTWGLYTIDPDGSHRTLVTSLATSGAVWSPDGEQIAFAINDYSGGSWTPSIAYVRVDGGEVHVLADGFGPSWRRK